MAALLTGRLKTQHCLGARWEKPPFNHSRHQSDPKELEDSLSVLLKCSQSGYRVRMPSLINAV